MCHTMVVMFLILVVVFTVRVFGHDSGQTQGICQSGWKEFNGRCYYFSSNRKARSWNQAKAECKGLNPGADLPSIGTEQDQDYIAKNAGNPIWIFLGGTDAGTEGQWRWTDGRPWVWSGWRNNEYKGGTIENCLTMKNPDWDKFWNDSPCDFIYTPSPLICSYKPGSQYFIATIGSSSTVTKTINGAVPSGYTCPSQASKDNWAGTDGYGATFSITQDGTTLVVRRTDVSGSGWGMNLQIICSRQEIISPLDIKMSSTSYGLLNCIDGKTNTFCETHGSETYPWITVVIPRSIVRTVRITNRVDCCGDRMENVKVWLGKQFPSTSKAEYSGGTLLGAFSGPGTKGQVLEITSQTDVEGTHVVVQMRTNIINLAEIEVLGEPLPNTVLPNPVCLPGWKPHEGKCYYFSGKENLSWKEAQTKCQSMRSNLASIASHSVQTFIKNNLGGSVQYLYLGGMDQQAEGQWKWVDGEPWGYTHWYPGEPNDYNGNEDCVALRDKEYQWNYVWNYQWVDMNCNTKIEDAHFVCSLRSESRFEILYGDTEKNVGLRLSEYPNGRVEQYNNGVWETQCAVSSAENICNRLGYTDGTKNENCTVTCSGDKDLSRLECGSEQANPKQCRGLRLCVKGRSDCYLHLVGRYKAGVARYADNTETETCWDIEHTLLTSGKDKLSTYIENEDFLLLNDPNSPCPAGYHRTELGIRIGCCQCPPDVLGESEFCKPNKEYEGKKNYCKGYSLRYSNDIPSEERHYYRKKCTDSESCNWVGCTECHNKI